MSDLKSEAHYGLALALGGGELTMQELVSLYATLANHGEFRLTSLIQEAINKRQSSKNPRPDTNEPGMQKVAWKTGTSWGFHDAWTIGVAGNDVLAVWVGNFDGKPNPASIGIKTAAPLLF